MITHSFFLNFFSNRDFLKLVNSPTLHLRMIERPYLLQKHVYYFDTVPIICPEGVGQEQDVPTISLFDVGHAPYSPFPL